MPRKRLTRSCNICRSRKVRLSTVGVPCSNCAKHSTDCVASLTHALPQQPQRAVPSARTHKFRVDGRRGRASEDRFNALPQAESSPLTLAPETHGYDVNNNHEHFADLEVLQFAAYISPLSTKISSETLELLRHRGALAFPPSSIVCEIVKSFLCYVYPLLPLIRLDDFLAALQGHPGKTISPLLFQAVLLAGAVFTDFSNSQNAEFQNSKDVQELFFGRAKLLYDFETEPSPEILVQSLLLMTYWHSQINDIQGRMHWLGVALSLAVENGLHDPNLIFPEPAENDFRRRLWSCCIIRSGLIAIGERRQVGFWSYAVSHQPLGSLTQWNADSFSQALEFYSVACTKTSIETLSLMFIQEVELCQTVLRTLDTLYELRGLRTDETGSSVMVLIPKIEKIETMVITLDEKLREWYRITARLGLLYQDRQDDGGIAPIHCAVLELVYLTALSTVHRPMMLQQSEQDTATEAVRDFSCTALRSSACRMTEIGKALETNDRISQLPPVATAVFITASIQHLKDALSPKLEYRKLGSLYLGQVLRIFRLLTERYNHTHAAIGFISRLQNNEQHGHSLEWEDRVGAPTGRQPGQEIPGWW